MQTLVIDWDKIKSHWQDILQVVLAIKTGKISSAVLLQTLGNYLCTYPGCTPNSLHSHTSG